MESTEHGPRLSERIADGAPGDPLDRQAVLARVQRSLFDDADEPLRIGRFVVSERLGAGASGVVYAAYDPQLDRRIAVKLLRTDTELHGESRARLLREAQVLARLSHPHVVAVHDVGDVDGRVFIAMELLHGGTLRQWVGQQPREPQQVLRVYIQAGEGLAAAHAAGLVHRDFKPDNVLLDEHGRARVVDFGLARPQSDLSRDRDDVDATGDRPTAELIATLTQTGAMVGTPAYMAPEQLAGRPADARTDQFSFCVSLYEALYGERPFGGETLGALTVSVERGEVRPPPPGRRVPARIRRALLRGLRPEPSRRHASMEALLAVLSVDPLARWRRRGLAGVVLAGAVGLTWWAAGGLEAEQEACSGIERLLADRWDPPRRAAVEAALRQHSTGPAVWARVAPGFDDYAAAWVDARRDVCEARELRHDESDGLEDQRLLCLDRALLALDAAAQRLTEADAQTIERADALVPDRTWVDECSERGVLDDGLPPPRDPAVRERLRELELRVAEAQSLRLAGKYTEALAHAEALIDEAVALDHRPTLARTRFELAASLSVNKRPREAIDALSLALADAERGRADRTRVLSTMLLVRRLADVGAFDEARRLATITEALYDRLAVPPDGAEIRIHLLWGHLEWTEGRYDAAIDRFDRAISVAPPSDDIAIQSLRAEAISHRGTVAVDAGRYQDALPFLQQALELRRELVGDDHPEVAAMQLNLGGAYLRLGDVDNATRYMKSALEIRERLLGPDHVSLASTLTNLGALALGAGRDQEALQYQRRALELLERSLGPDDAELAKPLHNTALALIHLGRADEALPLARRGLAVRQHALGPTHAKTLDSVYQVAYAQHEAAQLDRSAETYREYLSLMQQHRPEDRVNQAYGLVGLAAVEVERGHPAEAKALVERAQALLADTSGHDELESGAAFNLARALHELGQEPERAQQLARQALQKATDGRRRRRIARWLAQRDAEAGRGPAVNPG